MLGKPCSGPETVLRLKDIDADDLGVLLTRFDLQLELVPGDAEIPGSFWGEEEAGLIGDRLLARPDTPVHSLLHETCHFICMDPARRDKLDTNAGGDYDEENAVCYLQILLADKLPGMDRTRMWEDMDQWGYTFRLGSAQRWFERDASEARCWLREHKLINEDNQLTWRRRGT